MTEYYNDLMKNATWDLVPRPQGKNIVNLMGQFYWDAVQVR